MLLSILQYAGKTPQKMAGKCFIILLMAFIQRAFLITVCMFGGAAFIQDFQYQEKSFGDMKFDGKQRSTLFAKTL